MSSEQPFDIEVVIADLEARKVMIDQTIQMLRSLYASSDTPLGQLLGGVTPNLVSRTIEPDKVPSDAFFGMRSIGDAARKYLSLVKRKQTTKQIVEALEKGGFPHKSKTFYSTVYTALQRLAEQEGGDITRIGSEWAIASWYPGQSRRAKIEKPREPKTKAKAAKRGKILKAVRLALDPAKADAGS